MVAHSAQALATQSGLLGGRQGAPAHRVRGVDVSGFINVDVQPLPNVHWVRGAWQMELVPSAGVDLIYASHVLEHMSMECVRHTLAEWFRVLKPGGLLRLSVPDFAKIANLYQKSRNLEPLLGALMGGQSYEGNFHQAAFDGVYLEDLLREVGFSIVREWKPPAPGMEGVRDSSTATVTVNGVEHLISLNVEAVK